MAKAPHRVLEGGGPLRGRDGRDSVVYLYFIADMDEAIQSARVARFDEARAAGRLEGSRRSIVTLAPTTYVAGEETAALEVSRAGRPGPARSRRSPARRASWVGPRRQNVETLAGPGDREDGAGPVPGPMLCTLDESFAATRHLRGPARHHAPRTDRRCAAAAPARPIGEGRCCRRCPRRFPLGASTRCADDPRGGPRGGVEPGVRRRFDRRGGHLYCRARLRIAEFFKAEQCGQCPPCRMETNTIAAVFQKVLAGRDR